MSSCNAGYSPSARQCAATLALACGLLWLFDWLSRQLLLSFAVHSDELASPIWTWLSFVIS